MAVIPETRGGYKVDGMGVSVGRSDKRCLYRRSFDYWANTVREMWFQSKGAIFAAGFGKIQKPTVA
jgi:hypothetical protein